MDRVFYKPAGADARTGGGTEESDDALPYPSSENGLGDSVWLVRDKGDRIETT